MITTVLDAQGVELADLCIFADGAPSLDQLSTLALYVMAGDEEEFIKTGNLYKVRDEAKSCKDLVALHPSYFEPKPYKIQQNAITRAFGLDRPHEQFCRRHTEEHRPRVTQVLFDELKIILGINNLRDPDTIQAIESW